MESETIGTNPDFHDVFAESRVDHSVEPFFAGIRGYTTNFLSVTTRHFLSPFSNPQLWHLFICYHPLPPLQSSLKQRHPPFLLFLLPSHNISSIRPSRRPIHSSRKESNYGLRSINPTSQNLITPSLQHAELTRCDVAGIGRFMIEGLTNSFREKDIGVASSEIIC